MSCILPYKLGITGGIGSGKSYISQLLIEYGVPVFDTDSRAKELTVQHPDIRQELIALLGKEIYIGECLNKRMLADYLFANNENAKRINQIIHPRVKTAFQKWIAEKASEGVEVVGMESAILFESGFDSCVDGVLSVVAPLEVRITRVMKRDGVLRSEVERRISAQISDKQRSEKSDFILDNDGRNPVEPYIERILEMIQRRIRR